MRKRIYEDVVLINKSFKMSPDQKKKVEKILKENPEWLRDKINDLDKSCKICKHKGKKYSICWDCCDKCLSFFDNK